jgi:tRNA threonylcarbamoyladenosine biosynthesis protein TsaB
VSDVGADGARNLVAIETATETVGVAVQTGDGLRAELTLTGRRRHVESLTPALAHVLAQVGLAPHQLNVVAVDLGPGLFTGLRVGVAAAKGLAQALGIGVIGASSLEILFRAAAHAGHSGRILAAVDARRGEVFAAFGDIDATGHVGEIESTQLLSPAALSSILAEHDEQPVLAIGDGAQRYADVLEAVTGVRCVRSALSWPPPSTLLDLAAERLGRGETPVDPASVVPLYMREADAKSNFTQVTRV